MMNTSVEELIKMPNTIKEYYVEEVLHVVPRVTEVSFRRIRRQLMRESIATLQTMAGEAQKGFAFSNTSEVSVAWLCVQALMA